MEAAMRKAFVVLFAILAFTPALLAKGNHDWKHVEKLRPGTTVLIALWNGRLVNGSVDTVGPSSLRIDTADPDIGVGSLEDFGQADIRRIIRVRRPNLPDPQRWVLIGSLVGGGVGFTAGAIYDATHHEDYHWLVGGFGGALSGFMGSCVVLAGEATVDLFHHHEKLVYDDPHQAS